MDVTLEDNGDRTYLATYTVPNDAVGDYKLFVLLRYLCSVLFKTAFEKGF